MAFSQRVRSSRLVDDAGRGNRGSPVFAALADATVDNDSVSEADIKHPLPHLDHALTTLGWLAARNSGRPLHLRAQGVVWLMKSAVATAAAQWATVCIIVTIAHLR
ncbi:hypothetical protein GCM10010985_27130 [Caballeronia grimmiae]|uniref:Uncharacterized protein n=1 Tax=Caballeronia grimmiae TaxID=1071679 RepID=A0ABQ1RKH4_9BURK|nr:hypothetical protein GCM10010985_27130 [Caballeronia grimmiae]